MNVLSLFDGMSCGMLALQRAGIPVDAYYACEIDKHCIKVSSTKHSQIMHFGDVCDLKPRLLKKIDLILAGSPCQGFSRAGKGLSFEDPRSKLFFEFVHILNVAREVNPEVKFLLENVDMIREWQDVISKYLGVNPIKINSALLSAQNRERLYWTNIGCKTDMFGHAIPGIPQPKDLGIVIKDILQEEVDDKYYLSERALARIERKIGFKAKLNPEKTGTLNTKNNSGELSIDAGTTLITDNAEGRHVDIRNTDKIPPLRSRTGCSHDNKIVVVGVINENKFDERGEKSMCLDANYWKGHDNHGARTVIQVNHTNKESGGKQPYQQNRVYDAEGLAPALQATISSKTHAIIQRPRGKNNGGVHFEKSPSLTSNRFEHNHSVSAGQRVHNTEDKGVTLIGQGGGQGAKTGLYRLESRIRRLTPIECCRLQTVPDDYFFHDGQPIVSETQMYKMLGNGWTVDVIAHILKFL